MLFGLDSAYQDAIRQAEIYDEFTSRSTMVLSMAIPYGVKDDLMAIPADPDILLQSKELKWAMRMIVIMNKIELRALNALLSECTQARDELKAYMASFASRISRRVD